MKKPRYIKENNQLKWHSTTTIEKDLRIKRLKISFRMTAGDGLMGRLGGGWAWKLGAMGSGSELCLELIFFTLRFRWMPK